VGEFDSRNQAHPSACWGEEVNKRRQKEGSPDPGTEKGNLMPEWRRANDWRFNFKKGGLVGQVLDSGSLCLTSLKFYSRGKDKENPKGGKVQSRTTSVGGILDEEYWRPTIGDSDWRSSKRPGAQRRTEAALSGTKR